MGTPENNASPQKWKLVAAGAIVLLMAVYIGAQWTYYAPEPERPAFGPPGAAPGGAPPSRDEVRSRMRTELNLTDEQQQKLDELAPTAPPSSPEEMQQRIAAMEQVLTPEQREQMRSTMRATMQARVQEDLKRLPPEEREKFLKKLEEGPRGFPMMGPPPEGARP